MVVSVTLRPVFYFEKRHFTPIHGLGKRPSEDGIDISIAREFHGIVYGICVVKGIIESIPCSDKYAERACSFLPVVVLDKRIECAAKIHLPGLFLCCPMP